MIPELDGVGYLLGDGEYDANPVFDAAGAAGYQFWPRGRTRRRGWGTDQSPIGCGVSSSWDRPSGAGCSPAGGRSNGPLAPGRCLGVGCRRFRRGCGILDRVRLWVSAKLLINGVRIMALRKGLAVQRIFPLALPAFQGITNWDSPQLLSQQALIRGGGSGGNPATSVCHTRV